MPEQETRRWTTPFCPEHGGPVIDWEGDLAPCAIPDCMKTAGEPDVEVISAPDERAVERMRAERDGYLKRLGEVNVERQRQEVRAIEAEAALEEAKTRFEQIIRDRRESDKVLITAEQGLRLPSQLNGEGDR